MSGRIFKLGKGASITGGKVKVAKIYHSTSAKVADRKSPKTKVVRRTP